jgi:hypothetical protein
MAFLGFGLYLEPCGEINDCGSLKAPADIRKTNSHERYHAMGSQQHLLVSPPGVEPEAADINMLRPGEAERKPRREFYKALVLLKLPAMRVL